MNKTPEDDHRLHPYYSIVAIAASAGGLRALINVLSGLPKDFPVPVVVVQHLDPKHPSMMASLLVHRTPLRVKQAEQGDCLEAGTVYIAPPDQHLLISEDGKTLLLSHAALVHFVRPSADLLFESVAAAYKQAAIAVVLTGTGKDGSQGVMAIDEMGGIVIAQNESSAEFFGMPDAAIKTGSVDQVLELDRIGPALVGLVTGGDMA